MGIQHLSISEMQKIKAKPEFKRLSLYYFMHKQRTAAK